MPSTMFLTMMLCFALSISVAVSIGLASLVGAWQANLNLLAIVKEMFAAAQGHGAWLNERRLHTSRAASLTEALLATGFPPDMQGQEVALAWWRHFSLKTRSLNFKRRSKEFQMAPTTEQFSSPREVWFDVQAVLDEELERLPDKYRTPVVLCDLQEMEYAAAAAVSEPTSPKR